MSQKGNVLPPAIAREFAQIRKKIFESVTNLGSFVDKQNADAAEKTVDLENAVCEQSTDTESRIADIENALCDLSEALTVK